MKHSIVARNSLLSFVGQFLSLIVGIVSIPFVIKGLGVESFGILSLAWMLLGYFSLFDLGLGRATTRFIAEELRNGLTERVRVLFWSSTATNFGLGIIGGLILASLSFLLAESVFRIPLQLVDSAKATFIILAISTPFVLVSTAFRGSLEAAQRFEYVSVVNFISSSSTFLLPVVGLLLGFGVQGIMVLLLVSRMGIALIFFISCLRVFPNLRGRAFYGVRSIRELLVYGGWVSVSNGVNPILLYFDRFMIGSMASLAAVTYYAAPYEMVTRLLILPASLTMTLFPAFSSFGDASQEAITILYARSMKYLLLVMGPIVILLILFAGEVLQLWLGIEFVLKSLSAFRILLVGILFNSLAQISTALVHGRGRPDISAKFHLLELVIYIPAMWLLVLHDGVAGAALAWTLRVTLDSLLLFIASIRFINVRTFLRKDFMIELTILSFMTFALLSLLLLEEGSTILKIILSLGVLIGFAASAWSFALDSREREFFGATLRQFSRL